MASIERTPPGSLVSYLAELSGSGDDAGASVGRSAMSGLEIHLPESSLREHILVLGCSAEDRANMLKGVLAHKLEKKAQGRYNPAIVVIDPHGDLVRDTLKLVPPSIAHKVRLLDFGGTDRVPAVNLIDPHLFPDRDRCVDAIMGTVERFWEHFGGRAHDTLRRGLLIAYEFNSHADTPRDDMLTMLDIPALLEKGRPGGSGHGARIALNDFQSRVLSRVADRSLQVWLQKFQNWMPSLGRETVGPVQNRIQSYASARRPAAIMGRPGSTIILSDMLEVFSQGQVLLVSTAESSNDAEPAGLLGGALISLVRSAL